MSAAQHGQRDAHGEGASADARHHVLPLSIYFGIFAALLVLTGVTTWIAHIDLHALNLPVALLVAAVKAVLVILYFMHVRYSSRVVRLAAAAGFFWLFVMLALTMMDFLTRPDVQGWL